MVVNEQSKGTAGGTSSNGYNDRVLNTEKKNTITGASLSSNEITLPAGDYYVEAWAAAYMESVSAVREETALDWTETDDTLVLNGLPSTLQLIHSGGTIYNGVVNEVRGYFTAGSETTYKIRHYI